MLSDKVRFERVIYVKTVDFRLCLYCCSEYVLKLHVCESWCKNPLCLKILH